MANGECRALAIRDFLFATRHSLFAILSALLVTRQGVSGTLPGREEMIDHVEAALAPRPIDRGDVDDAPELTALVIAQKDRDLDDVARRGRDGKLTVRDPMVQHRAGQRAGDGRAELVENFIHQG